MQHGAALCALAYPGGCYCAWQTCTPRLMSTQRSLCSQVHGTGLEMGMECTCCVSAEYVACGKGGLFDYTVAVLSAVDYLQHLSNY